MKRREFALFLGGIAASRLHGAPPSLRPPARRFHLSVAPDEFVQNLIVGPEGLYYVVFAKRTGLSSLVGTAWIGNQTILWQLPENTFYSGLGLTGRGSFVLPCINRGIGMEVREFDHGGALLRTIPIKNGSGIVGYCVINESLTMLRIDGTCEALDLATSISHSFVTAFAQCYSAALSPMPNERLLIVDRSRAQMCVLGLKDGLKTVSLIDTPEISNAKLMFAKKFSEQKDQGDQAVHSPIVLTPSAVTSDNTIFAIVSPVNRAVGALVLQIDMTGRVSAAFRIALPDRNVQPTLPAHLVAQSKELYTIFANGEVLVYAI